MVLRRTIKEHNIARRKKEHLLDCIHAAWVKYPEHVERLRAGGVSDLEIYAELIIISGVDLKKDPSKTGHTLRKCKCGWSHTRLGRCPNCSSLSLMGKKHG